MATGAWAVEVVDLGGEEISIDADGFSAYKDKIIQNGTINMSGGHISGATAGKYTIGKDAIVNDATPGGPEFSGNWNFNIVNGGTYNQKGDSDHRFLFPFLWGNAAFTLDNGTFTTEDGSASNNAEALNFGVIWIKNPDVKDKDISAKVTVTNGSLIRLEKGQLRIAGARSSGSYKVNTLKVDFEVENSTIYVAKELKLSVSNSGWLKDTSSSYVNATFGPESDITCKQIYADGDYPHPSVTFNGATLHWIEGGNSFIGHNKVGDIYSIASGGLTVDIPEGKSLTCDSDSSSLKGEGGIIKIGEGSITWNNVSSAGTDGMTFTGPLVVSNGTWTSTLDYAASAFRADGGTLVLSGELSAASVAFAATEGGTLTLAGAEIPNDAAPSLTLAGGGKTDYFTRDGTVGAYTLDSLTLGEGAVLDLDANATAVDAINATTTITATSDNPATINLHFSEAPAAGQMFSFFEIDSADRFTIVSKLGNVPIPSATAVVNGVLTLIVDAENYTWNCSQANWGDTGAWTRNGVSVDWSNGNNAVFGTPNATATLNNNVVASEVRFMSNATVSGSGPATLTALKVNVAEDVAATISAPTSGSLEKTGEGTLTLGASRTEQTVVSEGTLVMVKDATVNPANLTLGTDAAKPVVFDYGGQWLAFNPASNIPARMDVSLTNGEFTNSGTTCIEDSTMRVAAGASFVGTGWICVGGKSSSDTSSSISACLVVDGGAVTNKVYHLSIGDYGSPGSCSKVLVANGGEYYSANRIDVAQRSSGHLTVDNSKVTALGELRFCNGDRCVEGENGYVSVTNGGEIATTAVKYGSGAGNGYFDFDGGTLKARAPGTLIYEHDRLFVSVNDEGGTIDNGGFSVTIAEDLLGAGAVTNKGAGSITYSVNQTGTGEMVCEAGETVLNAGLTVARPTTVASGATLTVNASAQATINTLTLDAGSTLNIASYAGTAAALSVSTLTLPDSGTVSLTLNGGAFPVGRYKILDMDGIPVADVERKFVPLMVSETKGVYSIDGSTLVLTVGTPVHGRWIGANGGNFADPGSWSDAQVPVEGEALDFSGVTANMTINCGDMSGTKFGAVTMGTSAITFTGSFMAASFSDTSKIAVGENSTVTLDGNLVFGGTTKQYIVYTVAAGGRFVVTGHIEASSDMTSGGELFPYKEAGEGAIQANGLLANEGTSSDHWRFRLSSDSDGTANWIVGAQGLSGSKYFFAMNSSTKMASIQPLDFDFTIATRIGVRAPLTLNTTGYDGNPHTITIGDGAGNGGIIRDGSVTITGTGKVVVNYDAVNLNTSHTNPFTVTSTATLALMPGSNIGTGLVTVNSGATLQVAQSAASNGAGAVTLGGNLTLKNGACLGFNYTTRNAPKLDLTGKTVTFEEGATTNVVVKITADESKRGFSGKMVLTSSGGQFAGVKVSSAQDCPSWVKGIDVVNGEIVLDVKPVGTRIIVR